ncbi:helix-turn-helix domain-containing protein [Agromyces sp. SYSU K20354]|uniref:helix-turn-helix domain-containing protein n=1 Tax=Agromyces cavernae TaxID=2898659 RepID=UPI001E3F8E32|nr:helix-turn-helix transcriptional regulator [Agromyces cavernae]MCD2443109.1 helix-turn-helix domain-containing protein [Agromyces cavernae]
MTAGTLVRSARKSRRLTQANLGRRAHLTQSHLSLIEGDRQNPSFETVERALRGAGHRLVAVPTLRDDAAAIAPEIRADLGFGRPERALRRFIQLNDDLSAEHGAIRFALAITEPESTGSKQWDAAIAALVAHHLAAEHLPVPQWATHPSRFLKRAWVFGVGPYALPPEPDRVPAAFLERRILIDQDTLRSV